MSPETSAWLANVRAEAAAPGALIVTIVGKSGSVAISPEDIVARSDDELQRFIERRLAEH